jgi:hypothetical protein
MTDGQKQFIEEFNTEVRECEYLLCIARDSGLQAEACRRMSEVLDLVRREKEIAIACADESYANTLLGCECISGSLIHELQMYLSLKTEHPEQAWDELIYAQESSSAAMRTDSGFGHLGERVAKLEHLEELLFPPQIFVSAGLTVERQICAICELDYDDCPHLAGLPYMGRFCRIRQERLLANHVAIVDKPLDKTCRLTSFDVEGGRRNRMTWKIEPVEESENSKSREVKNNDGEGGLVAQAIVLRAR